MDRTVRVKLNGRDVYGYPGQKILGLCAEHGIEIPTLCYDPHLSIHGGCSVCLVEVKNAKSLIRACATDITEGMEISTDTKRAVAARRLALELLLSDHVGDCRPPCTLACPANGDVQGYINLAAQGKYQESLDALHHHVTLPACIGRVCPAPCQPECRRNFVDEEPVSIKDIKRFVGDVAIDKGYLGEIPNIVEKDKSVAIVGGGPAGLSAAYYLRLLGYGATIYERESLLGGMMRYGIPDYRLPQDVLQTEIDWLVDHGVEVKTNQALGQDFTLDELRENYDAVILAMGCWSSSSMRAKGEELPGVISGIDFLYSVNSGNPIPLGKKVAVIGGGNTAMDSCRCAIRTGAEEVSVIYRRSREEMPADDIEIEEAMEEGIQFTFLAAPKAVEGDGKVERLLCEKMELGEPDASGRRRPVPTGETFTIEVDNVISAIGQSVELTDLPQEIHDGRRMIVDGDYATPLPGLFVCGDQQTGAKIAIQAIGNGHWAADSVDHYLTHGVAKKPFHYDIIREDLGPEDFLDREKQPREHIPHVPAEQRLSKPFEEYSPGLSEEQVLKDGSRCMECGCADVFECKLRRYASEYEVTPERVAGAHIHKEEEANEYYVRNMDKCILCGRCVRACDEIAGFHAIDFALRGFSSVMSPEFYEPVESSDCTFCGLCTQVCPVGALIEKRAERWPHSENPHIIKTTCSKCSVGCELELNLEKSKNRIVRITTDLDSITSQTHGHCCVKGRYHFKDVYENRMTEPAYRGEPASWPKALEKLSNLLKSANSNDTAILTSSSLLNEDYSALKSFFADLGINPVVAISDIDNFEYADSILKERISSGKPETLYKSINTKGCFLLASSDTDEKQPVISSWIRRSMRNGGSKLVYVGNTPGMLTRGENAIELAPGKGTTQDVYLGLHAAMLELRDKRIPGSLKDYAPEKIADITGIEGEKFKSAAAMLIEASKPLTLIGAEAASSKTTIETLAEIIDISEGDRYYLLPTECNSIGAMRSGIATEALSKTVSMVQAGDIKNLVLLDIDPEKAGLNSSDLDKVSNIIIIGANRPEEEIAGKALCLPMASWAERSGTYTNLEGVILDVRQGPSRLESSKELAWILSAAARRLGLELAANTLSH